MQCNIPGLSLDGHSYSGIHGGGREDSGYIPGLSIDGHSYSGIRGYSDMGGGVGGGVGGGIPGLSLDGHSYSQLSTKKLCHPWMAVDCLRHHWTYLGGHTVLQTKRAKLSILETFSCSA